MRWLPRPLTATLLCSALAVAAEPAEPAKRPELRVCIDDSPHRPWREPEADGRLRGRGLEFELLELLRARGWMLQARIYPWKRCMTELESGGLDAVMAMSHAPEREHFALLPMREGRPDAAHAVRAVQYLLVGRAGSGTAALATGARVGLLAGHSTWRQVQQLGFVPIEAGRSVRGALDRLLQGQVQAVVLSQSELNKVLEHEPLLEPKVQVLEQRLPPRVHYLGLGRAFAARHPGLAEALWKDLALVRDSPEFQRRLQED